jgi:flavin reductase (DIM6/NTAB) family NADH-FMN oxidoreductase RutF
MISIDPATLSDRDNYKFLIGSVIPRPIAFVTTLSKANVLNAAPFSFFNVVTPSPPLISISVQRENGKIKDTAQHAMDRGEFVVHISTEHYVGDMNRTARRLKPEESEIALTSLTPVKSEKIEVPGVIEAPVRMECVLERAIPLGGTTEGGPACDLLIGRVVQYHIREELYDKGRIDPKGLKPLARLAGDDYAKLGEIFELIRGE